MDISLYPTEYSYVENAHVALHYVNLMACELKPIY